MFLEALIVSVSRALLAAEPNLYDQVIARALSRRDSPAITINNSSFSPLLRWNNGVNTSSHAAGKGAGEGNQTVCTRETTSPLQRCPSSTGQRTGRCWRCRR